MQANATEPTLLESDQPVLSSGTGLSETDTRRIRQLREAERRYMRDGLEAAHLFCDAGRPAAVDRFIAQCLTAARRARTLARKLENRATAVI